MHSHTLRELPGLLSPTVVIPMHTGTFEITNASTHCTYGEPEEVRTEVAHPEHLVILERGGEAFTVSG